MVRSGEYLKRQTLVCDTPTEIFGLAPVDGHVVCANASSSLTFMPVRMLAPDALEEENRQAQVLDGVHQFGSHHVCSSGDGLRAASAGFGGELLVWVNEGGVWQAHKSWKGEFKVGQVWAIAMSEDGQFLAATSLTGQINVWNIDSGELVRNYETKGSHGMCIDLSTDGRFTATGHENGGIFIFNNDTNRLLHPLPGLLNPVRTVAFSPMGKFLAAAGDSKVIAIYDTQAGEQVANLFGHTGWITSLSWNSTGERLLSVSFDGKAKVWSIDTRECLATIRASEKRLWTGRWLPKTRGHEGLGIAGAAREIVVYEGAV